MLAYASSTLHNHVTLTFDLLTSLSVPAAGTAQHYVRTKFDVDSASRLSFRVRTHRQTDTQSHMPAATAGVTVRVINAGYRIVPTS